MDPQVIGTQRGLELLGRDPRFDATALQTLDAEGLGRRRDRARRVTAADDGDACGRGIRLTRLGCGPTTLRDHHPSTNKESFPWH